MSSRINGHSPAIFGRQASAEPVCSTTLKVAILASGLILAGGIWIVASQNCDYSALGSILLGAGIPSFMASLSLGIINCVERPSKVPSSPRKSPTATPPRPSKQTAKKPSGNKGANVPPPRRKHRILQKRLTILPTEKVANFPYLPFLQQCEVIFGEDCSKHFKCAVPHGSFEDPPVNELRRSFKKNVLRMNGYQPYFGITQFGAPYAVWTKADEGSEGAVFYLLTTDPDSPESGHIYSFFRRNPQPQLVNDVSSTFLVEQHANVEIQPNPDYLQSNSLKNSNVFRHPYLHFLLDPMHEDFSHGAPAPIPDRIVEGFEGNSFEDKCVAIFGDEALRVARDRPLRYSNDQIIKHLSSLTLESYDILASPSEDFLAWKRPQDPTIYHLKGNTLSMTRDGVTNLFEGDVRDISLNPLVKNYRTKISLDHNHTKSLRTLQNFMIKNSVDKRALYTGRLSGTETSFRAFYQNKVPEIHVKKQSTTTCYVKAKKGWKQDNQRRK